MENRKIVKNRKHKKETQPEYLERMRKERAKLLEEFKIYTIDELAKKYKVWHTAIQRRLAQARREAKHENSSGQ